MNEQQFLDALAKFAPDVRKAFIDAVRDVTDNVVLSQVIAALERGDAEAAWRALGFQQAAFNRLIAQFGIVFEQGGILMMASLPKTVTDASGVRVAQRFNIRDRRAEDWLRQQSSELITGIETDMRDAVREAATDGLAAGRNPRSTALDIVGRINPATGRREGGLVGLTAQQRQWARSARAYLENAHLPGGEGEKYLSLGLRYKRGDGAVERAMASGKPIPSATIDRLVDRYKDAALLFRGTTIGRTETLAALNRSEFEATMQALERAGLPFEAAKKAWDDTGDGKVRPSHRMLAAMDPIPIDQPFVSPVTGSLMMHPGDTTLNAVAEEIITCRCKTKYIIDFAYGVQ